MIEVVSDYQVNLEMEMLEAGQVASSDCSVRSRFRVWKKSGGMFTTS